MVDTWLVGDLLKLIANEFIRVPRAEAGGEQWFMYSQWKSPFNTTTQAVWAAVSLDTLQSSESEPQLQLCTVPCSVSLERCFRFLFVHFLYSNLSSLSKSDFPLLLLCFHEPFGILVNLCTIGSTFARVISSSLTFQIHSTIFANWKILLSNQAENQSYLSMCRLEHVFRLHKGWKGKGKTPRAFMPNYHFGNEENREKISLTWYVLDLGKV